MHEIEDIYQHVVRKLQSLSADLTYHDVRHTIDVYTNVIEIAAGEGISSEDDLLLLKVSALYHDTGFLTTYKGHEEISCQFASNELIDFGFDKDQINKICGMIRATKVPQQPKTKLEEIICDSDLDYLGRNDFFTIGDGLFKEFLNQKIITGVNDWNALQINFIESHRYFTDTAKRRRDKLKFKHLQQLKDQLT